MILPPAHIHIVGICGTAMASLAGLLHKRGYKITGSDQACYPPMSTQLEDLGIVVQCPYAVENLDPQPDLVIFGNVVSRHFDEVQEVLKRDIPYNSFPEAMFNFFLQSKKRVVIAGTHGKTTTTALSAWVFDCLNKKPGFLTGGVPKNFNHSFSENTGDFFIIEGDEYDTAFFDKKPKFFHYKPEYLVLTGVEFDHADIYQNIDQILAYFQELVEQLPSDGFLVANCDDKNTQELIKRSNIKASIVGYGFQNDPGLRTYLKNHFVVKEYRYTQDYQDITVECLDGNNIHEDERERTVAGSDRMIQLQTTLFGRHNILNTLSTYALCMTLFQKDSLQGELLKAFKTFRGVKRRQEVFWEQNDIVFIDDFAHHPTAVKLTIEAIRKKYAIKLKKGRLIAIFEPRSATSRRKYFQEAYAASFDDADWVFVAPPYNQANVKESERFSSQVLVEELSKQIGGQSFKPKHIFYFETVHRIVACLQEEVRPHDVVLIMSNGGFDGIYNKLIEAFPH